MASNLKESRTLSHTAAQVARRLVSTQGSGEGTGDGAARAAAEACGKLYKDLSRWVGPEGCHALFTRAMTQGRAGHPALATIQLKARSDPYVEGVAETIMAHGHAAAAKALEAMLTFVIELLARLIGDEMAMKLIQRSSVLPPSALDGANDIRENA